MSDDSESQQQQQQQQEIVIARHLRVGWWGLAVFVVLGTVLEVMHAIKSPVFVDAGRETTRLLLRLAHAHGTLLSLVNLAYAFTVRARPASSSSVTASASLLVSLVLLPGGFFAGAIWAHAGDPGLGVILVPVGAIALFAAAVLVARSIDRVG